MSRGSQQREGQKVKSNKVKKFRRISGETRFYAGIVFSAVHTVQ